MGCLFGTGEYCFPELPFSFLEVPSFYLLCVSFSKNAFFPADCTLSLSCSELPRETLFALILFCFPLELFIDWWMLLLKLHFPTLDAFLKITWSSHIQRVLLDIHFLQNGPYNGQETNNFFFEKTHAYGSTKKINLQLA